MFINSIAEVNRGKLVDFYNKNVSFRVNLSKFKQNQILYKKNY